MIKIVNKVDEINNIFENESFNLENWKNYMNSIYKDSANILIDKVNDYVNSGEYTFEKNFLPILNRVYKNPKLNIVQESFKQVTENLNYKIVEKFNNEIDIEIVLYMGLCLSAGWVTQMNNKDVILLGVEKIIDLNWHRKDAMYGLIYHELGHVYHKQHGNLIQDNNNNFVYQLFTEGIAMYFEQILIGDYNYYHQDIDGWKTWCDDNFEQILIDFNNDLPGLTQYNQRYFGDWADYCGKGDVGYYLGTRFVQYLRNDYKFDEIIKFDVDSVYKKYLKFLSLVKSTDEK